MSLQAKLEAVIYAAEEPVTLAQLASLFADEALAYKAEQDAARAEAAAEAASPTSSLAEFVEEGLENIGIEDYPPAEPDPAITEPAQDSTAEGASAEREAPEAASTDTPLDPEAEAKRLARLRDREVKAILRQLLDQLVAAYASDDRGVEIREIAGGYRMATKPQCHDAVRLFIRTLKPALKLSLPALETLAVIAYKQPVTAPEVNEIRGVDSSGVFGSLLSRKLITTAGRKQVIGRPILYKTTKEFLLRFGLKDVAELPSMEEFEKIAAIELSESDAEDAANDAVGGPLEPGSPDFDEYASEEEGALTETATVPLAGSAIPVEPSTETPVGREVPEETETPPHD
jgi:segregation and condensation protein B